MPFLKKAILFVVGGFGYVCLEFLWRGWSHISMFFAGGTCFSLLGKLEACSKLPLFAKGFIGSGIITAVELLTGLFVNQDYSVWDYRKTPLNYRGQICLPFTLLWVPISLGAMMLYRLMNRRL